MYPDDELIRLAAYQRSLRRDIARRRVACVEAAEAASRPLHWAAEVWALGRRIAPLLALAPLGVWAQRLMFPRAKLLGQLMRWTPLVLGVVRRWRGCAGTEK